MSEQLKYCWDTIGSLTLIGFLKIREILVTQFQTWQQDESMLGKQNLTNLMVGWILLKNKDGLPTIYEHTTTKRRNN